MIVTCAEMKALEQRAFAEGTSAEALMDEAGAQVARAIQQFFPRPGTCIAVFGKGHNGGDAMVAARHLAEAGWATHLVPAFALNTWSPLTRRKFDEAGRCHQHAPGGDDLWSCLPETWRRPLGPLIILDGLLGIGASGGLREPIAALCREINAARERANAQVFAIDIPTGLDGDTGETDPDCVIADYTLTVGAAKCGLVADAATHFVGRLCVLHLSDLSARGTPDHCVGEVATPATIAPLLRRRNFDSHKGDYGRIGIIAGSRGLTGAAVMTSAACVHAGAGLVTLYVPEDIYPIAASAAVPEVMVHPVASYREAMEARHDVLAVGPGIGQGRHAEVLDLIRFAPQPMVLDADGLNILAKDLDALESAAGPRLLTPHPGEMARLAPDLAGRSRSEIVESWISSHRGTLLLKGSRTLIGERGRPLIYNSTGNPGMGSGGMGDVLTGTLAALAGQGLGLYDAAQIGAWVCGRAAEVALSQEVESEESISATKLMEQFGKAFGELRARCY